MEWAFTLGAYELRAVLSVDRRARIGYRPILCGAKAHNDRWEINHSRGGIGWELVLRRYKIVLRTIETIRSSRTKFVITVRSGPERDCISPAIPQQRKVRAKGTNIRDLLRESAMNP